MSVQVLIADGDEKRAQRIAEACRAGGLTCQVTSHGAAALEAALAELPVVLVAQLDLPLIDGPKLAAILRANPRTQPTRLLFVSERAEAAARRDLPGRLIAAPVDADEVASAVRGLLADREVAAAPAEKPAGAQSSAVEGDLSQIALADLLELFHVNRETGIFELRAADRPGPAGARPAGAARRRSDRRARRHGPGREGALPAARLGPGRLRLPSRTGDRARHDPAPDPRAAARGQAADRGVGTPRGRAAAALRPRHAEDPALRAAERAPPADAGGAGRPRALLPRRRTWWIAAAIPTTRCCARCTR